MKKLLNGISIAAGCLLVLGLAGCNDLNDEGEVQSVDWYQANKTEREAKLAQCMSGPEDLGASPDCINASRAQNNSEADTHWIKGKEDVRTPASVYD
ncbi:hypothetical protein SAMN05421690_1003104 [Nitrosomonas sp. Nm51]|uniref:EexN family lipoprotein n=1 Tax=Nitrosomonas sp. Nm51 TaxID=133720 RepID=UPI0008CE4D29|nr:EexN family lipoprotein [Nitrosomonas sp. Nm51]SEQ91141.1 hypothetical protein SAMN05421690_1003104 [Nitrosomonas sp. Nm51]